MVTPAAVRSAVAHVRANHGVSERRACLVLGADRSTVRYRSRRPDDAAVRERLRELSRQRRRFGYRRLHLLLAREGHAMNQKKLRRLYREEKLQVRRRGGRKRALGILGRLPHEAPVNRIIGTPEGAVGRAAGTERLSLPWNRRRQTFDTRCATALLCGPPSRHHRCLPKPCRCVAGVGSGTGSVGGGAPIAGCGGTMIAVSPGLMVSPPAGPLASVMKRLRPPDGWNGTG